MTESRELKAETRFAERAKRGRGVGLQDAVAAAEKRLEAMGDDARSEIDAMLGRMQGARPRIAAGDPAAFAGVRADADALTGLAPIFAAPEVAEAAVSLRRLYDACAPAPPSADAVRVHLDALLVFRSGDTAVLEQSAPTLLEGLARVVAAAHAHTPARAG